MYGIPRGETFNFLRGRRLDQVCFGRHQLQLRFDEGRCISIEGSLGIQAPGSEEIVVEDTREVAAVLMPALASCVMDVVVNDSRSFSMRFEGGLIVRVIDSSPSYESFQVNDGDRLIIA